MSITPSRIGFVATHFNDIDRVSLESSIWCDVLTEMGHECFFFTGESSQPEERTVIVPEAQIHHPDVEFINHELYQDGIRTPKTSGMIQALRFHIKQHLHQFVRTFDINLLIVENALSLPSNIPLGLALSELIAETGIPTIAHHHDFSWEYPKYICSPAEDYIRSGFPPKLPSIQHVVASHFHADLLALRSGMRAHAIPYVRNFQPGQRDDRVPQEDFIKALGIQPGGSLLLSTSSLLPSSQIEIALAFIARMDAQVELLISMPASHGQENYVAFLQESADLLDIPLHFIAERLWHTANPGQGYMPTLEDCYQHSAMVANMGQTQGALAETLDAIFHRRLVLSPKHTLFQCEPNFKQLQLLTFEALPTREAVKKISEIVNTPDLVENMIEGNFKLGQQHFSLQVLERKLAALLLEDLTPGSD